LIVGGFEGVYEFSKNFRNEGMDRTHKPGIYRHGNICSLNYNWMMKFAEDLLEHCAIAVNGTSEATFGRIKSTSKHLMLELL
jgi:lysyl-tRNA synthetase class 2